MKPQTIGALGVAAGLVVFGCIYLVYAWVDREWPFRTRLSRDYRMGGYVSGGRRVEDLKPPPRGPAPGARKADG